MPDFTRRVRKKLTLPDGETVEHAAVARPRPSLRADGDEAVDIAGRIRTKKGYLIVTDVRFLWAAQTYTGAVGNIEAELTYREVVSAEIIEVAFASRRLSLVFADGSTIDLTVSENQTPERLAEAVRSKLT